MDYQQSLTVRLRAAMWRSILTKRTTDAEFYAWNGHRQDQIEFSVLVLAWIAIFAACGAIGFMLGCLLARLSA
jgi:hypothetical protein